MMTARLIRLLVRLLLVVVIAVAHIRAIFVLFPSQNSAMMRFVVPTVAAMCLYLVVILRRHFILSLLLSAILTGLSLAGGLILAVNTYGT